MGMMLEGVWRDVPRDTKFTGGAFLRPESRSMACPWAHRTLIVRPDMLENGWELVEGGYLYEIYAKTDARYAGRVTLRRSCRTCILRACKGKSTGSTSASTGR